MGNYLLRVAFDGLGYHGTQRQKKGQRTVQGELEAALFRLTGHEVRIRCSSRLDSGVSATDFCISFKAELPYRKERLLELLNGQLGKSIHVKSIQRVRDEFDARGTPHRKRYRYLIDNGAFDPILDSHAWVIPAQLDLEKIQATMNIFLGKHSFASFASPDRQGKRDGDFTSEITETKAVTKAAGKLIYIYVSGHRFHRYQVRMMVGAAVQASLGKISLEEIERRLEQPDIDSSKYKAPAEGLTLVKTEYRGRWEC